MDRVHPVFERRTADAARPQPSDVQNWFADILSNSMLKDRLWALRCDPNWQVVYRLKGSLYIIEALYFPTGEHLHIMLRHTESGWCPYLRTVPTS